MEAGYDYTLMGERVRRRTWVLPALFTLALSAILLFAAGGYYGFTANAQAVLPPSAATGGGETPVPVVERLHQLEAVVNPGAGGYVGQPVPASASAIAGQQLYPAGLSQSNHWVNPLAYEP